MKKIDLLATAVLFTSVAFLANCNKQSSVQVSCKNLDKYQSRFGLFNAQQYNLGDVFVLNSSQKKAFWLQHIKVPDGKTSSTRRIDSTEIISNAEFEIQASAKLPAVVTTQILSDVKSNTLFQLQNHTRTNISDPPAVLNTSATLVQTIERLPVGQIPIAVTGIINATDATFKLRDSRQVIGGGQLKQYGNYKVEVTYGCQASLTARAQEPSGLFFKISPLKLVRGKVVEDTNPPPFDFNDYNFVMAKQTEAPPTAGFYASHPARDLLYDRLGGYDGIAALVSDFVSNVGADQRINKFFAKTDLDKLKMHLVNQICEASGGPCKYTGRSMREAHQGMGISGSDFSAFVDDLLKSLNKFNVSQKEQYELLGVLGGMKGDIVDKL